MKKRFHLSIIFLFFSVFLLAQNITTTLRGTVKATANQQPLPGATLSILNTEPAFGTTTDSKGNFLLQSIPIGRYQIQISFLGYETLTLTEVLLEAGKESVLEIELAESAANLKEVVVKAGNPSQTIAPISNYEISIEEMRRMPATFFDPARLAMLYPGVAGTNDQANGLSIRGLSPGLTQWRLEGAEIINPNHLANAGTISDQPSVSAGGVNMLSAQMLDNSRLFTGAAPTEYANVAGGVMDMRLRKGNNQQREFTVQAGLLGFDIGMEGPFSKNKKASFLFNYRYSFTGLLSNFGIDFDGESINFEDVAFNFNFPTKRGGNFMVFGMGGRSSNFKEALPLEAQEVTKDASQIDYLSQNGVGGLVHEYGFGKVRLRTVLTLSASEDERGDLTSFSFIEIGLKKQKYSLHHEWAISFTSQTKFQFGLQGMMDNLENVYLDVFSNFEYKDIREDQSFGFFVNYQQAFSAKWKMEVGANISRRNSKNQLDFGSFFSNPNNEFEASLVSPKLTLLYLANKNHTLSAYLKQNEFLFPITFQRFGGFYDPDPSNGTSKVQQAGISWNAHFKKRDNLRVELFYQRYRDVPIVSGGFTSGFFNRHLTNESEGGAFLSFSSESGKFRSWGMELLYQKFTQKNAYFHFSSTVFKAEYQELEEAYQPARFAADFMVNGVFGKEFSKQKEDKERIIGFNVRGVLRGGFRERRIDFDRYDPGYFSLDYSDDYDRRQKAYFRVDTRFYLKWHKPNRTSTLSLDIQNTTNQRNEAYQFFDFVAFDVLTQEQLGLIPLLNYRIDF